MDVSQTKHSSKILWRHINNNSNLLMWAMIFVTHIGMSQMLRPGGHRCFSFFFATPSLFGIPKSYPCPYDHSLHILLATETMPYAEAYHPRDKSPEIWHLETIDSWKDAAAGWTSKKDRKRRFHIDLRSTIWNPSGLGFIEFGKILSLIYIYIYYLGWLRCKKTSRVVLCFRHGAWPRKI